MRTWRNVLRLLPFVILIGVALCFQAWAASKWRYNFGADDALLALMAKHIAEGKEFPIYTYGIRYGGPLLQYLSAPLFWLFEPTVPTARIAPIASFGFFLGLHSYFVNRTWGRSIALRSLLFLIVPATYFFEWTFKGSVGLWLSLCTFGCLLGFGIIGARRRTISLGLAGLCFGVAAWILPTSLIYLAAWLLASVLTSEEVKRCLKAAHTSVGRPASILGLAFLAPLTWGGCYAFYTGQLSVIATGVCAVLLLLWISSIRKQHLFINGICLVTGLLIGNAPQWMPWMFSEVTPSAGFTASFPSLQNARIFFLEILPSLFGSSTIQSIRNLKWEPVFSFPLVFVALALYLIALWLWTQRRMLVKTVTLQPLDKQNQLPLFVLFLFLLPILALSGLPGLNETLTRYLFPTWHASSVILAIAWLKVENKSQFASYLILGIIVIQGALNFESLRIRWTNEFFPAATVAGIEHYLEEHDIDRAFADYWLSYPLSYLFEEKIIVATYRDVDRYAPHRALVDQADRVAYIFHPWLLGDLSLETDSSAKLADHLQRKGLIFKELAERLNKARLIDRTTIGGWQVWIVEQSPQDSSTAKPNPVHPYPLAQ